MLIAQSVESILSQVDYKAFFYNVLQKELLCSHIVICILKNKNKAIIYPNLKILAAAIEYAVI